MSTKYKFQWCEGHEPNEWMMDQFHTRNGVKPKKARVVATCEGRCTYWLIAPDDWTEKDVISAMIEYRYQSGGSFEIEFHQ